MAVSTSELQTLSNWLSTNLLADTCAIRRQVLTSTGSGGFTSTWSTIATVPCQVVDAGAGTAPWLSDQRIGKVPKQVLLPRNTVVLDSDHLLISGVYYRVLVPRAPDTYEIVRRVTVVRDDSLTNEKSNL